MILQAMRARGLLARAAKFVAGTPARAGTSGFLAGSIAGIDVPSPTKNIGDMLIPVGGILVATYALITVIGDR